MEPMLVMCARPKSKVLNAVSLLFFLLCTIIMFVSHSSTFSFPKAIHLGIKKNLLNFIGSLLAFRTSIEKLAVEVENKLRCPAPDRSPGRSQ